MPNQIRSHPSRGTRISQNIILFYIYTNTFLFICRYLHIKVFSFVPKVDLTFINGHMSDNISYYELLQLIRYTHKYNANIRIRIGFWVANIQQGTNVAHNIMGGLQIIAMFHL